MWTNIGVHFQGCSKFRTSWKLKIRITGRNKLRAHWYYITA